MPLTAAERQRRQKLKDAGKYERYRKHHCEVAKKSRDKKKEQVQSLNPQSQEMLKREATRKHVAKCRTQNK